LALAVLAVLQGPPHRQEQLVLLVATQLFNHFRAQLIWRPMAALAALEVLQRPYGVAAAAVRLRLETFI
jgi:hypothetical protein